MARYSNRDREQYYKERLQPKLGRIERLARRGKNKQEIAKRIGVDYQTMLRYAQENTELNEALISGYRASTDKVVGSMLRAATGYTVKEKTIIYDDNHDVVEVKVKEKHIPPMVSAQVRFLKMVGEFDTVDEKLKAAQIRNTTADAKLKEKLLDTDGKELPPIMQWLGGIKTVGVEENEHSSRR